MVGGKLVNDPVHLLRFWVRQVVSCRRAAPSTCINIIQSKYHLTELWINNHRRVQQASCVHGVAVKGGILTSLPLPKASTATEGHAAQACLRALTVALLCFYKPSTVADVLAAVLPYGLLNYDQEGVDIKMEGPIYASILNYIKAVAVEEDTDPIRQSLLDAIETKKNHVSGASLNEILPLRLAGSHRFALFCWRYSMGSHISPPPIL